MEKNNNKPKLRFPGFTDPWEQRKLGEILDEFTQKSMIENQYEVLSSTNSGMEFRDGRVSGASNKGYKIIENGDLVLSPQNLWLGNININDIGIGLVSPSYKTFKIIDICPEFLKSRLRTQKMLEEYRHASTQGASVVRRNLDIDAFNEIEIMVPNKDEQIKIGTFLKDLDHLSTLHQHKLNHLQDKKKSLLQKIFPKNGEDFPELGFQGFTNSWKQRKFGEIGTVQTCKRIFKEQTSESGDIPFYKNGTLGLKADAYISREIFEEYKKLYPYPRVGDILISVVGSIGRTAEYKGNDEYFQDSNIVWLKTDNNIIDKTFLKISYQIIDWLIEGSTIKHLYNDNILASKIWIPSSIDEQKAIGRFFDYLDNLITLHQRKLNHLQEQKKALLQQMFV